MIKKAANLNIHTTATAGTYKQLNEVVRSMPAPHLSQACPTTTTGNNLCAWASGVFPLEAGCPLRAAVDDDGCRKSMGLDDWDTRGLALGGAASYVPASSMGSIAYLPAGEDSGAT